MVAQGKGNGVHGENGVTFEQSFGRLQEVVQRLSEGSLTLQEALTSFEEGMALADMCLQMLDEAELRLRQVSARTARSAAQALEDLDAAILQSPLVDKDDESIEIEIETYETRLSVEAAPDIQVPWSATGNLAYSPLPGERRGAQPPRPGSQPSTPPKKDNTPEPQIDLDPLFDEDD